MKRLTALSALAVAAMVGLGPPSFASDGAADQESGARSTQQSEVPSSDATRIVGRVVQIERAQGLVALATDEGMLIVQAPPQALESIDVGDFVAVPRALAEGPDTDSPSALPRMDPPGAESPRPHMRPTAPSTDRI